MKTRDNLQTASISVNLARLKSANEPWWSQVVVRALRLEAEAPMWIDWRQEAPDRVRIRWRGKDAEIPAHISVVREPPDQSGYRPLPVFVLQVEAEVDGANFGVEIAPPFPKAAVDDRFSLSISAFFSEAPPVETGSDWNAYIASIRKIAPPPKVATTAHLLTAIASGETKGRKWMRERGTDPAKVIVTLRPLLQQSQAAPMGSAADAIQYIEAYREAAACDAAEVTSAHALLAILRRPEAKLAAILEEFHWNIPDLESSLCPSRQPDAATTLLGNPTRAKYPDGELSYARNVWDLKAAGDRLYIGTGNSSNYRPATNAGPVDVWYWDIKKAAFVKEFTVDDEQIDRFYSSTLGLLIPGHDPRESWDFGNLYFRTPEGWKKLRTIPNGIHCYDVIEHDGFLYVGLGTQQGAAVARSKDRGATWETFLVPSERRRVYSLFALNGALYASTFDGKIARFTGSAFESLSIDPFPNSEHSASAMMVRVNPLGRRVVYIGGDNVNDHQWSPFGLFTATSETQTRKVQLPGRQRPYDLITRDGAVYLLTNEWIDENAKSRVRVRVLRSDDLSNWAEVLHFDAGTFARSFEFLDGYFYFGLGTSAGELSPETGDVRRTVNRY